MGRIPCLLMPRGCRGGGDGNAWNWLIYYDYIIYYKRIVHPSDFKTERLPSQQTFSNRQGTDKGWDNRTKCEMARVKQQAFISRIAGLHSSLERSVILLLWELINFRERKVCPKMRVYEGLVQNKLREKRYCNSLSHWQKSGFSLTFKVAG